MSNFDVETATHPTLTNCPDTAAASQALTLPDLSEFSLQTLHMSDPIESLGLPTRVENCLKKSAGIKTLKDFSNFPNEKLIKIKNVGLKTQQLLIQLKIKIRRELQNDRKFAGVQGDGGQQKIRPKNMVDLLLSQCRDERACDVIAKRYGLRGEEKQTLEEIGQHYELTRERIRQIQVKALRRMKGAFNTAKQPIVGLIKEALYINDGLLSEEEADLQIPSALEEGNDDGSSVLDLLSDLGWIQSSKIGDITIYSPLLSGVGLGKIIEKITDVIENESLGIDLPTLTKKVSLFKRIQDKQFEPEKFVLRYCHIDPRIREINLSNKDYPLFQHYRHSGNFSSKTWVELMRQVLETEQAPLHFTEMANKVNDLLRDKNKQLEVRRAHSLLIEDKTFAHTGIRGTYGLTVWGLRRETTPQLIEECIKKAGFPLHWRQIYNYVSKYKDSKPGNIISVLEFNQKFQKLDNGVYGLSENI